MESAYSSVGHVNYGHLGNCLANLWINGPLGLGYRAGARLTYPARHTPLSPIRYRIQVLKYYTYNIIPRSRSTV